MAAPPPDDLLGYGGLDDFIGWVPGVAPEQMAHVAGAMDQPGEPRSQFGRAMEAADSTDGPPEPKKEPTPPWIRLMQNMMEQDATDATRTAHASNTGPRPGHPAFGDFGDLAGYSSYGPMHQGSFGQGFPPPGADYGYGAFAVPAGPGYGPPVMVPGGPMGFDRSGLEFFNDIHGTALLPRADDEGRAGLTDADAYPVMEVEGRGRRGRTAPGPEMRIHAVKSNAVRNSNRTSEPYEEPRGTRNPVAPSVDMAAYRSAGASSVDESDVSASSGVGGSSYISNSSFGSYASNASGRSTRGIKRDWALLAGEKDDGPRVPEGAPVTKTPRQVPQEDPDRGTDTRALFLDDRGEATGPPTKPAATGKKNRMWTVAETEVLVAAVEDNGVGKWSRIARLSIPELAGRTSVDFKDRWRNLARIVATGKQRGDSDRALPAALLSRIEVLVRSYQQAKDARREKAMERKGIASGAQGLPDQDAGGRALQGLGDLDIRQ